MRYVFHFHLYIFKYLDILGLFNYYIRKIRRGLPTKNNNIQNLFLEMEPLSVEKEALPRELVPDQS